MSSWVLIFFYLFIGLLFRKLDFLPEKTSSALNKVIINLCLPALIINQMSGFDFQADHFFALFIHWALLGLLCLIVLSLSKIFNLDKKTTGCFLLLVPLGNTSFLGYPMVESFFGQRYLVYGIIYDQLGSFLALSIYAPLVLNFYSPKKDIRNMGLFKKIVFFPPFLALVFSLLFGHYLSHPSVEGLLNPFSKGIIPLAMISVGLQLDHRLRKHKGLLFLGLFLKMVMAPFLAFAITLSFGHLDPLKKVAIFQSGMPPMITAALLAFEDDLNGELALSLMSWGVLLSFVTLPIIYFFLK
ncbi:AEC family transporter [Bacteriovoracales bacterium]|nr:AEC family transporter [Bacteriovoracales bacterium]